MPPASARRASDLVGRLNVLLISPRAQRGKANLRGAILFRAYLSRSEAPNGNPAGRSLEHRTNRKTFKQQRLNRYANGRDDRLQLLRLLGSVRPARMRREAEKFVRVGRFFLCWASQTQEPRLFRVR